MYLFMIILKKWSGLVERSALQSEENLISYEAILESAFVRLFIMYCSFFGY